MAEEKEKGTGNKVEQVKPKEGVIDITKRVKVTTTSKAPYHKVDQELEVSPVLAEKMKANGWAK